MKASRVLNAALLLILVGIWGFMLLSRPDSTRRNFRWLPQMEDPLAFETQRQFLPGVARQTAGAALEGAIPRGFKPFPYRATPEDADRAGREVRNPLKADDAALQRGAQVYAAYCFPCHGGSGLGDGPVTKRGVPAPPSLFGDKAVAMSDGKMFHVVSLGQGNMAAYASQIDRDDRWRAVLHVRALQAAAKAKTKAQTKVQEKAK